VPPVADLFSAWFSYEFANESMNKTTSPQLYGNNNDNNNNNNNNVVMGPRWLPDTKADWPTDRP
jgi:hypothetical protein